MFKPLGLKKVNVLENISLNVPTSSGLSSKSNLRQDKAINAVQVEHSSSSSNENKSVSSRSSQSDFSDVVKLNGPQVSESAATNKDNVAHSVLESKPAIALFIGDLHKQVTEEILTNIFGKFESLVSVKVCTDARTGKSLGYGYLNFLLKEDTLAAIEEFNYRPILGKDVRIMPSLRNSFYRKNMGTNVFFSNLPLENPSLTTRTFYDTFKIYGNILSCKLDKRKNIGFVYFDNDYAARIVIREYNGKIFFGNKILCGIHFDRDLRKFPEFEKRKSSLNEITIPKEELTFGPSDKNIVEHNSASQIPHPNAVFVKNLPPNCTDVEILDFFSEVGPIKSVFSSAITKYNSIWAFITYKKGSDTKKAIDFYQGTYFKSRKLHISKAQPKDKELTQEEHAGNHFQSTIFLQNLSSICNEQFLTQMCIQERIKIVALEITTFYEETLTYAGYVKCKSRNDANRMFKLLNNRLIGGCVVRVTWGKPKIPNGAILMTALAPFDIGRAQALSEVHGQSQLHGQVQQQVHVQPALSGKASLPAPMQAQSPIFSLPVYPPFFFPAHPMTIAQKGGLMSGISGDQLKLPWHVQGHMPIQRKHHQMQKVLDYLKRQVRKGIDFLRYPSATREENLSCITEYIFEVYWQKDLDNLSNFLLLLNSNTHNESILNDQIEEAAKYLGFGR